MFEVYLLTLIGVISAQASPGPNLIAVASAALGQGRTAALYVTLGVSTGMLIWAVAIAYGLGTLFIVYPVLLLLLKFVGGSYLLWLSWRALRSALTGQTSTINADSTTNSAFKNWKRGILVVLTNPKAALMWSAVGAVLFGANLDTWQVVLFGPVGATTGFIVYGSYAILFSTAFSFRFYKRFTRWIDSVFAASFGALGGKLIVDGIKELRS